MEIISEKMTTMRHQDQYSWLSNWGGANLPFDQIDCTKMMARMQNFNTKIICGGKALNQVGREISQLIPQLRTTETSARQQHPEPTTIRLFSIWRKSGICRGEFCRGAQRTAWSWEASRGPGRSTASRGTGPAAAGSAGTAAVKAEAARRCRRRNAASWQKNNRDVLQKTSIWHTTLRKLNTGDMVLTKVCMALSCGSWLLLKAHRRKRRSPVEWERLTPQLQWQQKPFLSPTCCHLDMFCKRHKFSEWVWQACCFGARLGASAKPRKRFTHGSYENVLLGCRTSVVELTFVKRLTSWASVGVRIHIFCFEHQNCGFCHDSRHCFFSVHQKVLIEAFLFQSETPMCRTNNCVRLIQTQKGRSHESLLGSRIWFLFPCQFPFPMLLFFVLWDKTHQTT